LEPKAFCQKYARLTESDWGYKSNWERLLAHCCRISVKTVRTWGTAPDFENCPEVYRERLAQIDVLKQAEQILRQHQLHQDYLDTLE